MTVDDLTGREAGRSHRPCRAASTCQAAASCGARRSVPTSSAGLPYTARAIIALSNPPIQLGIRTHRRDAPRVRVASTTDKRTVLERSEARFGLSRASAERSSARLAEQPDAPAAAQKLTQLLKDIPTFTSVGRRWHLGIPAVAADGLALNDAVCVPQPPGRAVSRSGSSVRRQERHRLARRQRGAIARRRSHGGCGRPRRIRKCARPAG